MFLELLRCAAPAVCREAHLADLRLTQVGGRDAQVSGERRTAAMRVVGLRYAIHNMTVQRAAWHP